VLPSVTEEGPAVTSITITITISSITTTLLLLMWANTTMKMMRRRKKRGAVEVGVVVLEVVAEEVEEVGVVLVV
jgi:hypothetical protein